LYPYPWNLGLSKQISAVKVGKYVRAILPPVCKGQHVTMNGCPNGKILDLTVGVVETLAPTTSNGRSRILNAGRGPCPILNTEISEKVKSLFSFDSDNNKDNTGINPDCIVLPTLGPHGNEFAYAEVMGIANDSITRIDLNKNLNASCDLSAFSGSNYQGDQHDFLSSKTDEWGVNVKIKYLFQKISSIKLFCP
jgi:hypothetical protein